MKLYNGLVKICLNNLEFNCKPSGFFINSGTCTI
jgi:hypothetical protein